MQVSETLSLFDGTLFNEKYKAVVQKFIDAGGVKILTPGQKAELEDGVAVVYLVTEGVTDAPAVLEAHRRYFDLHYTITGTDIIAYEPLQRCMDIKEPYNDTGDYILFNGTAQNTLAVSAGNFCLIGPEWAHMALYGKTGPVVKLVFKVPVKLA